MAAPVTPERVSAVDIHTYADGQTDIDVTGKHGTLTLTTHPFDEPLIAFYTPTGGKPVRQAAVSLRANGQLFGWLVRGDDNHLEWFPARKKRGKKQPAKKRTTTP
jgi:hypothetical protein